MRVHDISIFANKSFVPSFNRLGTSEDIILRIHSSRSGNPPKLTIFFADLQEATNFKNAVIQSWETYLKEVEREKS